MTPDGLNYLVNKDLRGERWTISLNLSAEDPARRLITNVTGNVFSAGEAPAFVVCQARPDSTGSLSDLESTFRFSCQGSSACLDTALSCSQGAWTVIAGDVQLPASFFLPESRVAATTRSPASSGHLGPQATPGTSDRGVTFSYDGLSYLVSKDVDNRRWSIVVNLSPRRTQDGLSRNELSSVTGNVFNRDGSPPQFVYCQTTDSSEGDFGNPKSVFRFRCQGADACVGTSEECARNGWRPISDSVEIPASFLLPPAGSGIPRSDPRLIIIGRTSDPSAVATDEFTPASGASSGFGRSEAPCEGACFANSIGPCTAVPGRLLTAADGRCVCLVENIADACIACGSDQCGRPCSFPVGSHDARGVCLPFDALGSGCLCNAVGADGSGLPELCAGALASQCPRGDKCCVDDPSDGCEPSAGDAQCAGLCASSAGCDAATQACGVCSDPCGNGTAEGLEECDRGDLREASCQEIGLGAGRLSCRADCRFDTTRCRGPTETPGPEDTPTPTPGTGGTPTPTPSALPATPTPTPGPSATPTPSPMATPTPSPEPPMPTCGSLGEACVVGTCCPGSFCSGGTCQPF